MPRIQLLLYLDPDYAEVIVSLRLKDGNRRRVVATVDTGAEVSLLPRNLLNELEYRVLQHTVTVQQAGIARHEFVVDIALIKLFLEDWSGNQSEELEVTVWFADTDEVLVGFDGVLDRAKLYIDMLEIRTGWIEF